MVDKAMFILVMMRKSIDAAIVYAGCSAVHMSKSNLIG